MKLALKFLFKQVAYLNGYFAVLQLYLN